MKVAIDVGPLSNNQAVRGIGVMVKEQIQALKKQSRREKNIIIKAADFSSEDLSKYDVVHYPYFFPFVTTLPSGKIGKKVVVTIQDLIHLVYPKQYPPGCRGRINFLKQKRRLKNVDAVITISETSKKDIVRFLGIKAEKIHVVYLAPKKIFKKLENGKWKTEIRKRFSLPKRFVLYVGDINYNKNIPNLIKACKIVKTPLVIVGKQALDIEDRGIELPSISGPRDWIRFLLNIPHPELAHYDDLIREFSSNKDIIRSGFIADRDLVAIYNLATVYCQPSFYEGFGLPVLEAMACGTPVISSKTQALVEIAGNAALFFDPKDPSAIALSIKSVLSSKELCHSLVKKGNLRVSRYSWEETGREIIDVYQRVDRYDTRAI